MYGLVNFVAMIEVLRFCVHDFPSVNWPEKHFREYSWFEQSLKVQSFRTRCRKPFRHVALCIRNAERIDVGASLQRKRSIIKVESGENNHTVIVKCERTRNLFIVWDNPLLLPRPSLRNLTTATSTTATRVDVISSPARNWMVQCGNVRASDVTFFSTMQ